MIRICDSLRYMLEYIFGPWQVYITVCRFFPIILQSNSKHLKNKIKNKTYHTVGRISQFKRKIVE